MRKVKFFASLTALMTLSVAALTACTTAEASTHHTVSQTGGESVHSSRLDAILERGYIEVATEPSFAPNEFIDTTKTGQLYRQRAGSGAAPEAHGFYHRAGKHHVREI